MAAIDGACCGVLGDLRQGLVLAGHQIHHGFYGGVHQLQCHHQSEKAKTDAPFHWGKLQDDACDHYQDCHDTVDLHVPFLADTGESLLTDIDQILEEMVYIQFAEVEDFLELMVAAQALPHTDYKRYPTVMEKLKERQKDIKL